MMNSFITSINSVLSSYNLVEQQPIYESSVANLSTRDRESLVHIALEINPENDNMESSLAELEMILVENSTSLEAFEKKERFLGVRIDRYRVLMDRREERMHDLMNRLEQSQTNNSYEPSLDDDDDLENKNLDNLRDQLNTLQCKHIKDQKSLQEVENLHKDIIAQVEIFRRRIDYLEEKQQDLMTKRDECQDFLVAAADCT